MSARLPRLVLASLLLPVAARAQLAPGRLEPGNFPAYFLKELAAAPVLADVENGAPRWLAFNSNHANQSYARTRGAITLAQRDAWDAQVRELFDHIRAAAPFQRSLGLAFSGASSMSLVRDEYFGPGGPRAAPLAGTLTIASWEPRDVVTGPDGRLRTARGAHTSHFVIRLNDIPPIWPGAWMRDAGGNFHPLRLDARLDGLPMHGWSLVLTRDGRSPYAPVSWERAVAAFLASHLGQTASAAEARTMLARMSATERRQQAWVCGEQSRWSLEHCFVPAGTPGGVPLVGIDSAFFDRRLPRTALQVISIVSLDNIAKGSTQQRPNTWFAFNLALLQSVDWRVVRDRFVR